jgi:hypothetical protein
MATWPFTENVWSDLADTDAIWTQSEGTEFNSKNTTITISLSFDGGTSTETSAAFTFNASANL